MQQSVHLPTLNRSRLNKTKVQIQQETYNIPSAIKFTNKEEIVNIDNLRTRIRQSRLKRHEYDAELESQYFKTKFNKVYQPNVAAYSTITDKLICKEPKLEEHIIDRSRRRYQETGSDDSDFSFDFLEDDYKIDKPQKEDRLTNVYESEKDLYKLITSYYRI